MVSNNSKTYLNIAVLSYIDGYRLSLGASSAANVLRERLGKGSFLTVKTSTVEEGDAPLEDYLRELSAWGLPVGRGQEFHALIGPHSHYPERLRSLVIVRRRKHSYSQERMAA